MNDQMDGCTQNVPDDVVEPVVVPFPLVVCAWFVLKGRVMNIPNNWRKTRRNSLHSYTNSSVSVVPFCLTKSANHVGLSEVLYELFGSFRYVRAKLVEALNHVIDWKES